VTAHAAGLPLEEMLAQLGPALAAAAATVGLLIERARSLGRPRRRR
jgi:hypothetical protein